MKTNIFLSGCLILLILFTPVVIYSQVTDDSVKISFTAAGVTSVKAVCKGISSFAGSDTVILNYLGNRIWSKTLTEVPYGFYYYHILINEAPVYDQASFAYYASGTWVSAFEVKDTGNTFSEEKTGPFGSLHEDIYKSEKSGIYRKCRVYVPAGYNQNSSVEYPVVYLLPDAGENSSAWVYQGKIGHILDNAIETEDIAPMLVVLADRNLYKPNGSVDPESGIVDSIMISGLISFVDSKYQTLDSAKYRAIAGCSEGGLEALQLVEDYSGLFNNLGVFSLPPDFDTSFVDFDKLLTANPSVFWLGVGSNDASYLEVVKLNNSLNDKNIDHHWDVQDGSYNWLTWRINLYNMLKELFKTN